jgi:hypothetical protein
MNRWGKARAATPIRASSVALRPRTVSWCIGNVDNFRGFPDISGNDFVMSYPTHGMGGG